jgi:Helicase associated domain
LYQVGKLGQGKIDLMNELDFDWEPDPPATWEEMFEELSQYKDNFASTLVNKRINHELGQWIDEMPKLFATGDLDPEWTCKLN